MSSAPELGPPVAERLDSDADSVEATWRSGLRHLALVPEPAELAHDHLWALRDTEFNDMGISLRRFECDCGAVNYT